MPVICHIIFVLAIFFFQGSGDHRDLHNKAHSFPTRRSSDLRRTRPAATAEPDPRRRHRRACPASRSRSEEHTSELQLRLVISYAVFCLKKKKLSPPLSVPSITTPYSISEHLFY